MDIQTERVTPKKAEQWINRNTGNRKLREGVAEAYAEDMKNGKWTECLDPIAFYENGDLANGQHRLWAIIESGTTQEFLVARNVPRDAGLNIDVGLARTLVDNARISGVDPGLSNEMVAVSRFIEEGDTQRGKLTNAQRLEFVNMHREAAEWTISHGPRGKGLRSMATLAAVGRAWYAEQDRDKIARFCEVVSTGLANGKEEHAAICLRNYLIAGRDSRMTGRWTDTARAIFLKTMNAISYFMRGKTLSVIKNVKDEAYPKPRRRRATEEKRAA